MQWISKPCRTFCPLPKISITITPIHVIRKYLPLLPYADFTDFPLWTQLVFVLSEFVGSSSLLQKVIPPVFSTHDRPDPFRCNSRLDHSLVIQFFFLAYLPIMVGFQHLQHPVHIVDVF